MNGPGPLVKDLLYVVAGFTAIVTLLSPVTLASGSISTGSGGVSQYGQLYKQGKVLFFKKVACSREACPVKRDQVGADLAAGLVESLRTRAELKFETSENDAKISVLCPGENAGDCAGRPDEQEMVQYYLTRRFNIKS